MKTILCLVVLGLKNYFYLIVFVRLKKFYLEIEEFFIIQVEVMKNNVDSRVKVFIQEVEKFSVRWYQLKFGDDVLDGDKKKCEAVVQVIKDKRQEFVELEKIREIFV